MKEELVSFETAKLAKEKGFDLKTQSYYGRCFPEIEFEIFCDNLDVFGGDFSCYAPTKSLLQKWLREKHLIFVTVKILAHFQPNAVVGYLPIIQSMSCKNQGYNLIEGFRGNQSYEEALELGLKEALELLP